MACEHKEQLRGLPGIAADVQQNQLVAAALPGHRERVRAQQDPDSPADLGCVR